MIVSAAIHDLVVVSASRKIWAKPGNSTVVIIAREDDDLMTQRTFVVHRKQPIVAQKGRAER